MRILQITPYFGEHYGGTERYCYNLSKAISDLGHDVQVFSGQISDTAPRTERINGVTVRRFPTLGNIWNINPMTIMLHRLLTMKVDIVHVHSYLYFASNQAIMAKIIRAYFRQKTPIILHLHGGIGIPPYMHYQAIKKTIKRVYDSTMGRLMMRGADLILSACQSDSQAAQKYFNIPSEKIAVVHNAIDLTGFTEMQHEHQHGGDSRILFVGDLERWKGLESLLKGMHILKTWGMKYKLALAGTGSLEPVLRKEADGLDAEFLGLVPHDKIPTLMSQAFALVLPSLWEGIPTVGLEAMAVGTPLIGTNIGGIPEIITNHLTGLLVPPNNPVEIANAIQQLQDTHLRRTLIRNAAKNVAKRFSIEAVAKRTTAIYEQILNR